MNEKQLKYLYDIKIAVEEIESYFETEPRNFNNYKKNSLLKRNWKKPWDYWGSIKQGS